MAECIPEETGMIRKILKTIGIILLVLIALIVLFLLYIKQKMEVNDHEI